MVEVGPVEAPIEWACGVVVTLLERGDLFGEVVEVGEVVGVSSLGCTTEK